MKLARTTVWGLRGAVACSAALALDLPDPTRPPYAVSPANNNGAGAPQGAARTAGGQGLGQAPAGEVAEGTRPSQEPRSGRLSAVLLADAPGRNAAVIDGQVRYVGDRLHDGTLAGITAGGVTIKGSGRTLALKLYDREPEAAAERPKKDKVAAMRTPGDTPSATIESSPSGALAPGKEQP